MAYVYKALYDPVFGTREKHREHGTHSRLFPLPNFFCLLITKLIVVLELMDEGKRFGIENQSPYLHPS